ncbi:MAG: hypothetical protein LH660_14185 [Phormidesmis sp. CAN_BIN36]|nr:hypothetical protein [Phormidesmis sp. CAN_BIN36]
MSSNLSAAKAEVIGKDDRITPSYEWMVSTQRQAIGQLEIQKADKLFYTCTFTAVGRNIGLTNAHCLLDAQGRAPLQIKAFALRYGSRVYASANVDWYWTGLSQAPSTLADQTRDWAIVRFTTNLGTTTSWFGNEAYDPNIANAGKSVTSSSSNLIGYSGGGTTPTAHLGCYTGQVTSGLLMHYCDSETGASGSSLHTNGRRIQALHWGAFTYRGSRVNGAVPLERFMPAVQKLRDNGAANGTVVPVP